MNCCWPFSKDRSAVLEDFLSVNLPPFIFSWSCVLIPRGCLTVHSCAYLAFGCWFLPSGIEELKGFSASILHSPFVIGLWGQAFSGFLSMGAKLWLVSVTDIVKERRSCPFLNVESTYLMILVSDPGPGSISCCSPRNRKSSIFYHSQAECVCVCVCVCFSCVLKFTVLLLAVYGFWSVYRKSWCWDRGVGWFVPFHSSSSLPHIPCMLTSLREALSDFLPCP